MRHRCSALPHFLPVHKGDTAVAHRSSCVRTRSSKAIGLLLGKPPGRTGPSTALLTCSTRALPTVFFATAPAKRSLQKEYAEASARATSILVLGHAPVALAPCSSSPLPGRP